MVVFCHSLNTKLLQMSEWMLPPGENKLTTYLNNNNISIVTVDIYISLYHVNFGWVTNNPVNQSGLC